ncbi:hypothetical protein T492DRAFT_1104811 [Pavlovales sp. CCMP2436]|nr:hypothetical protein T492DRAFT_1104811 [Pavlovales sp. CCMP2436]
MPTMPRHHSLVMQLDAMVNGPAACKPPSTSPGFSPLTSPRLGPLVVRDELGADWVKDLREIFHLAMKTSATESCFEGECTPINSSPSLTPSSSMPDLLSSRGSSAGSASSTLVSADDGASAYGVDDGASAYDSASVDDGASIDDGACASAPDVAVWYGLSKLRISNAYSRQRRIGVDVSAHVTDAAVYTATSYAVYTTQVYTPPSLLDIERGQIGAPLCGSEWEVRHRYSEWAELHAELMRHPRREFRRSLAGAFPTRLGFGLGACGLVMRSRQQALDAYLAVALDVAHEVGLPDSIIAFLSESGPKWRALLDQ